MSAQSLRKIAETDVTVALPEDEVQTILLSSPFIWVAGTFNTRDLGLVPSASGASSFRQGFAFRSGALSGLTNDGKALIAGKLGVKKIFDLRSVMERQRTADPDIEGVRNIWVETAEKDALINLADFVDGMGEKGYELMYLDVLHTYQQNFKDVLAHVRDAPDEPFLFHCTAGRDRTGVLAGMLLTLAGVDPETVTLDFLLSRVGTEPAREQLVAFARKGAGIESADTPGFVNLCNLKAACWRAFLNGVDRDFGGFDGYVTKTLGFSEEDLAIIKSNLVSK